MPRRNIKLTMITRFLQHHSGSGTQVQEKKANPLGLEWACLNHQNLMEI